MLSSICVWFSLLFPQKRSNRKESIAFVPFIVGVVSLLSVCFKAPLSFSGSPILFLSTFSVLFAHCSLRELVAVLLGHLLSGISGTLQLFRPFSSGFSPSYTTSSSIGVQSMNPAPSSTNCMQATVVVSMIIGSIISLVHITPFIRPMDTCLSCHSDFFSPFASPLLFPSFISSISFDRAGPHSCAHLTSSAPLKSVGQSPC